jgi:hypothetical protein
MHTAIKQARINDKFQDPLYLFLELVRAGVMHGNLWSGRAFSGGPSFGTGVCATQVYFLTLMMMMVAASRLLQTMRNRACCW